MKSTASMPEPSGNPPSSFPYATHLNDECFFLGPREGFVVPKGVRHRTRAPERAVILMLETAAITPTGD